MRRAASAVLVALGAALPALVAGCAGDERPVPVTATSLRTTVLPAPPAAPAVPGISAEAVELRTDRAAGGRVQVRITATGAAPFTVTAVALESPGFAPLPPTAVDTAFRPGRTIDLPTPYGPPVCTAAAEPAAARLALVGSDGAVREVRVPLAGRALAGVHDRSCAAQAVRDAVGITVVDLTEQDDAATGVLLLVPQGSAPVTVAALRGSVLVEAAADADLPLGLSPAAGEVAVPVSFSVTTCEPHVLAETKQPYLFSLGVAVGPGEPVPVDLPLDAEQRGVLAALVQRVCG